MLRVIANDSCFHQHCHIKLSFTAGLSGKKEYDFKRLKCIDLDTVHIKHDNNTEYRQFLHRDHREEGHGGVVVPGPALDVGRGLALGQERVVVLVEARDDLEWGRRVKLVVVVRGGVPVVGVVVAPEAIVVSSWETWLVVSPEPDCINPHLLKQF